MELIIIAIYASIFLGLFTMAFYLLGFLEHKRKPSKRVELPLVSIIIPAYNEEEALEKTVESAYGLNYPKNKYEILIVDDGSKDRTLGLAKALEKKYENVVVFTKKNGGKGSALNYGIGRAKGEIIVSFDSDSMVEKEALRRMIPYFEDGRVMCVTPTMKVYKPRGILQRVQAIEYDLGIFLRKAFSKINAIHVTPGPFSAYRKVFFEKHGGYDEHNITEDMEIALRIQSLNYRIENSIDSVVYTISPRKLFELTRQRRRWYFGMMHNLSKYKQIFGKKYGELGMIIMPLAVISVLSTMVFTVYHLLKAVSQLFSQWDLYSSIGFDFANTFRFKWYLVELSIYNFFSEKIIVFSVLFIIIIMAILFITNRKIKSIDRPFSTFISYGFFLVFYTILYTFWWIISIVYVLRGKGVKW